MKRNFVFSVLLLVFAGVHSTTLTFQEEFYSGSVTYNEEAKPGEAVFARLSIKPGKNSGKKSLPEVKSVLQLWSGGKKIENSSFYLLPQKSRKNYKEFLSGIPLSSWLKADKDYQVKILISIPESEDKELLLPFSMNDVKFIEETIDLNAKNTGIKQNMSAERLSQIEKLNKILGTVDETSVYALKPFVKPVSSERMTAFYGDRRIFRYSNGKTETSLHYGDDYGVPEGTEVRSAQEGKVVLAEFRISTGWSVVIEHLPGLYSLYYHLSSLNVKEGDRVKSGEKIGLSGSTGLATGPHLHWEVRLNAGAVKPDFFRKNYTFEGSEN